MRAAKRAVRERTALFPCEGEAAAPRRSATSHGTVRSSCSELNAPEFRPPGLSRPASRPVGATGINEATLCRIEKARARPQKRTLVALLHLYSAPEEYTAYIGFESEARTLGRSVDAE
ncbi:hypothetical protein ACFV97_00740 [Streptomyces sp. NPDC059913]|uniref:hypothetical protein n=1 Tax=unclassified Streptomyces TaxID=2593676 RepID=UPI003663018C